MKKPMTIFRAVKEEVKPWEFKLARGNMVYAEHGHIKTYANKTQAYKKVELLTKMGLCVAVAAGYPFLIMEDKAQEALFYQEKDEAGTYGDWYNDR